MSQSHAKNVKKILLLSGSLFSRPTLANQVPMIFVFTLCSSWVACPLSSGTKLLFYVKVHAVKDPQPLKLTYCVFVPCIEFCYQFCFIIYGWNMDLKLLLVWTISSWIGKIEREKTCFDWVTHTNSSSNAQSRVLKPGGHCGRQVPSYSNH